MTPVADPRDVLKPALASPVCPVCKSAEVQHWARAKDVEYYTSADWFDYFRCEPCDVLFLSPLPADRLSEIYPSNYYAYAQSGRSFVQRVKSWLDQRGLRRILREIAGDRLSALDIGGGTGEILNQVRAVDSRVRFTQVVDLDPKAEQIALSRGHAYARSRIEDFPADRSFDLILLLNLIEHVEDPISVLRKAGSMLAPQGRMLVKTPNFDSLDARLFRHRSWGGYHCPRHWTLFTAQSFERAASAAGLRVNRISYTQGAPFWAISIFELLRKAGWVKASADAPAPFHPLIPVLQGVFAFLDLARTPFSHTSQIFVELSRGPGL
ncbi:MAG: class I SAM-dependent methyltransferase [Acidobacteriia bacterium]|nr:class I SAM-dependent methyltransferase [Terriglobia bacterium]